jgi:hypothetical protein
MYELVGGNNQIYGSIVPQPPAFKLIKALLLLSNLYLCIAEKSILNKKIKYLEKAMEISNEAIIVSDNGQFLNSGANARLINSKILLSLGFVNNKINNMNLTMEALLDWIISNPSPAVTEQQRRSAYKLLEDSKKGVLSSEEKAQIVFAMSGGSGVGGYHGHWYQCENGHEYFIDNCGGANQVSNCMECGAVIGGTNYVLHSTNTRAQNLLHNVDGFFR